MEKREVRLLRVADVTLVVLMGVSADLVYLACFLIDYTLSPQERASAVASSFAASLVLVREGKLEVRQNAPFAPIYMRASGELNELDEGDNV